jgi:hypothetical protein
MWGASRFPFRKEALLYFGLSHLLKIDPKEPKWLIEHKLLISVPASYDSEVR